MKVEDVLGMSKEDFEKKFNAASEKDLQEEAYELVNSLATLAERMEDLIKDSPLAVYGADIGVCCCVNIGDHPAVTTVLGAAPAVHAIVKRLRDVVESHEGEHSVALDFSDGEEDSSITEETKNN